MKSDKNKVNTTDKSNAGATKKVAMAITGKKLPFIGRMPVFKKQSTGKQKKTFFTRRK